MKATVTALALALTFVGAGIASASPVMYYSDADGSRYGLDASSVGSLYTLEFTADFTGVTASGALGDYAMLISFQSIGATWTVGGLVEAPGTDGNWQIIQNDSNSNGCKSGVDASEWCIELKHTADSLTGPEIGTGTILTWRHTMTLTSGTPDFTTNWPFKFTTTTGVWDSSKGDWAFGGDQIARELVPCTSTVAACAEIRDVNDVSMPEPASMVLFGTGLLGLAALARRRARQS